ncbi:MAG: mannonate dehydratase [Prevotellaceae bacterium]|jgi:mannonate dehydratase|nr:mannonate dehydratase [Prevotellaceae bacterium]
MERTWRWFGKKDPITLDMLRQIGVEGIVTSLHDVPNGEIWTQEAVNDMKNYIEQHGLRWSVVESLPVSEAIKYGGSDRERLLNNYKISLASLGNAGVKTVCYNFMPVIDWIRTDLQKPNGDGTYSLFFDPVKFAYFDCCILARKDAANDYPEKIMQQVYDLDKTITETQKDELIDTIIVKTQGFVSGNIREGEKNPVHLFKQLLALYTGIDREQLRANMKYFLQQVIPVAEEYGVNLCVHPDDPPFPVLGLPRIVTSAEDIEWFLHAVDNPHNGLTFCAGSLSSGLHNDVIALAQRFAKRTHFLHLRSTEVDEDGYVLEASHLEGRGHVIELVRIFERENPNIPMRIDHGRLMLDDVGKTYNPGYSFLGRMYAFAQVMGVMAAVKSEERKVKSEE